MAAVISLGRPAALLGRSGWSRGRHQSKARRATEWPKLSFARSNGIASASVLVPMQRPSCDSYRPGLPTTTRFTRTKLEDGKTLWHIRTGQWILNHAKVPIVDFYSYTAAGTRWISTEWLAEIFFALSFNIGEWRGVVILSA